MPIITIAENPSSTFPKDDAGIAAYVKISNIDQENNATKLNKVQSFLGKKGTTIETDTTHVIGTFDIDIKRVTVSGNTYVGLSIPVNIYFDIEGWLVAYLDKGIPSSKIIQWTDYSPSGEMSTILEEAIKDVADDIDSDYGKIKYYHFQYPEANRISVIVNSTDNSGPSEKNYSVTLPGPLLEASYSFYYSRSNYGGSCRVRLKADENTIEENVFGYWCQGGSYIYDFYPNNTFLPKTPHSVKIMGTIGNSPSTRIAIGTVLIYEAL